MVDATYIDNDRVQIIEDDDIAFDSERPSVVLFDDSTRIIKTGFEIAYPSPIQFRAYYRNANGSTLTTCELWSTFIWQEWGPGEVTHNERYFPGNPPASIPGPTTRNLPRIFLGTVPPETDYIDVRVRLTRTKVPANMIGVEPPICFLPEGDWFTLAGESCPTEYFFPLARLFNIVRVGTNVYLDRYQSVKNGNSTNAPGDYPQRDISGNVSGWQSNGFSGSGGSSDGTPASSLFPRTNIYLAGLIQQKPYDNNGTKRPGGTNVCAGSFPDFGSTYTGDIIITPGKYIAP